MPTGGRGNLLLTVTTAVFGSLSLLAVVTWWRRKMQHQCPPKLPLVWQEAGKVEKLYLYPVKSCRGMSIDTAECEKYGFQVDGMRDRVFIVVDEKHKMITARKYPSMIHIVTTFAGNMLTLQAPQKSDISVSFPPSEDQLHLVTTSIWGDEVKGYDCGDDVAEWLSLYILEKNEGLRLVYHVAEKSTRPELTYTPVFPDLKSDDVGLYSDLSGYMLLTEASIADLNDKLIKKVTDRNFRPNILVGGTDAPYAEDKWQFVKIGDVIFHNSRPSNRCVFTTIDPDTGEKDANSEPLKTLKSYRQSSDPEFRRLEGSSPMFGINLGLDVSGHVSVGDTVYIGRATEECS